MRHVTLLAVALLLATTQASAVGNYTGLPPSVPEPAAIGLFAAGCAIVSWAIYRRRK